MIVAKALRKEEEGARLPRWRGVIHLSPDASAQYQSVAAAVAARIGICRVHLDLLYWRPEQRRDERFTKLRRSRASGG